MTCLIRSTAKPWSICLEQWLRRELRGVRTPCRRCADGADFYNRAAMAEMAVAEFAHFKMLRTRLLELGADPDVAMAPFVEAIDGFHASTAPK